MRTMDERMNLIKDTQDAQMLSMLPADALVRRILLAQRRENMPDVFTISNYEEELL